MSSISIVYIQIPKINLFRVLVFCDMSKKKAEISQLKESQDMRKKEMDIFFQKALNLFLQKLAGHTQDDGEEMGCPSLLYGRLTRI